MAKILFVQNCDVELNGIQSIASYINKKHQVEVALGSHQDIIKKYKLIKPDIVGVSMLTKDHNWTLSLAAKIKSININTIILLGGAHPTFYTEILNSKNVDAICIGEGEKPVLNLLNRIDGKEELINIPSIWIKKDNKIYQNKNEVLLKGEEIPILDISIYKEYKNILKSRTFATMTSRGCPFSCYFCYQYQWKKKYGGNSVRTRRVEDIIREIQLAIKSRNIDVIRFQNDCFGLNKEWLKDFLKEYKEKINLPFYCQLRFDGVTENKIDQLVDAGCFMAELGIESGDEHIRNKILNKNLSDASIKNAAMILKKKKLKFNTFNMLGLPEESYRLALKTLDLNIQIKPEAAWCAIFQPYAGSKFFSDKNKDIVLSPFFNRFRINYNYSKDSKKIQRLQRLFMLTVKFPIISHFLFILVRLPLGGVYKQISNLAYTFLYSRRLKNGGR